MHHGRHTSSHSQATGITTSRLLEKAEHLLAHEPTYSGHDGASGIKFIAIADNYIHCNQETAHRMIAAVTARLTLLLSRRLKTTTVGHFVSHRDGLLESNVLVLSLLLSRFGHFPDGQVP
jgi:hypothetical protein